MTHRGRRAGFAAATSAIALVAGFLCNGTRQQSGTSEAAPKARKLALLIGVDQYKDPRSIPCPAA